MARPIRVEFPGAVYHITSRGNAQAPIFLDDGDKRKFLDFLAQTKERFNWLCHAYCLMDNHYHLLAETIEGNLSRGMRHLNGVYTQWFNFKHKRAGHIFQGRYKAILVEKDSYLLSLCRYVVLNPVKAGLVKAPEDWPWSSYRATVENNNKIYWLTKDWLLSQFGKERTEAAQKYQEFVQTGINEKFPWDKVKGQVFLGKQEFFDQLGGLVGKQSELKEIPRTQRTISKPALEKLLGKEKIKEKNTRNKLIHNAYIQYGYTFKEIADYLKVHYATISRVVRQIERNGENVGLQDLTPLQDRK